MIKTIGRILAIGLLVLTAVVTVLLALAWAALPLDGVTVNVGGETFSLAGVQGWHAVAGFVGVVAAVVLGFVLGAAGLVVGLGFGALGIAIGLIATIGALALVVAPFALIVWGLWRLFRGRPAPTLAAGR